METLDVGIQFCLISILYQNITFFFFFLREWGEVKRGSRVLMCPSSYCSSVLLVSLHLIAY